MGYLTTQNNVFNKIQNWKWNCTSFSNQRPLNNIPYAQPWFSALVKSVTYFKIQIRSIGCIKNVKKS
jgi:hypothetical protein